MKRRVAGSLRPHPAVAPPPGDYQVNADGLRLTPGRAGRDPGRGSAVGRAVGGVVEGDR